MLVLPNSHSDRSERWLDAVRPAPSGTMWSRSSSFAVGVVEQNTEPIPAGDFSVDMPRLCDHLVDHPRCLYLLQRLTAPRVIVVSAAVSSSQYYANPKRPLCPSRMYRSRHGAKWQDPLNSSALDFGLNHSSAKA